MKKMKIVCLTGAVGILATGCTDSAASIGVIGGADGPTAVYVASRGAGTYPAWPAVVLVAAGVAAYFLWRHFRKK